MAKIKHLAIRTTDVEKTVAFYKEVFGLKQVGLGISGVYLSDGHINLAILKPNRKNKDGTDVVGIDHLGFLVEDVEGTLARLNQMGGKPITDHVRPPLTDPSNPQSYYEIKCSGPDEQEIDISSSGWAGSD